MRQGLSERGLLNESFESKFREFSNMQSMLGEIAGKQLSKTEITEDEYEFIFFLNDTLNMIETFPDDNPYENDEDTQVALIADVHTDPNSASVLEEGIGNPDTIVVVAEQDGG